MADQPVRARKPVEQPQPETPPSIRRLYWYSGAGLGILAGMLLAMFVVPPIFDRYFGVADIALGDAYDGDDVSLRVLSADAVQDATGVVERFDIVLNVERSDRWCPEPSTFRLELEENVSLGGATLDPPPDCASATIATGPLTLSFDGRGHDADSLRILHLDEPSVRFWLKPGEPGE